MSKRVRVEDDLDDAPSPKRVRSSSTDRLSNLSDELILRVLGYLPVSQLVVCQRYVYLSFMRLSTYPMNIALNK